MAIDAPSGGYGDDPEQDRDSPKERDDRAPDSDRLTDAGPAETRSRAGYYEALRAADRQVAAECQADHGACGTQARSAWDAEATVGHPDRPPADSLRIPPERSTHILDGDRWGGGHRHGTGRPGKTEFPSGWDDEKIIGHILDVARIPGDLPVFQSNRRWRVHGQRDDVGITVIVQPDGRIWSAWPDAGSPGVARNPRETQQ